MIFEILFFLIFGLLNLLTGFLPEASTLPWGLDPIMVQASSYWHGAMETIPYLQVVWSSFLIAMGFELALFFIKIFLGSRTPGQHAN